MVCDFCRSPDPCWVFACEPFIVMMEDGTTYIDDGSWAACSACRSRIEAGDACGLIRYVTGVTGLEVTVTQMGMLSLFLKCRLGPALPLL